MSTIYLAELRAYDPAIGSEIVVRVSTAGYVTQPTDTPPNVHYAKGLSNPGTWSQSLFRNGATFGPSEEAFGEIEILNDGSFDVLRTYGFDGRECRVLVGDDGAALSTFTEWLVTAMESVEVGRAKVTVRLRDWMLALDTPLQTVKYAGDNVLPDGVEGVATDLKDKPKPVCVGTVKNAPAVQVNSSKLIWQVNDGPISSLDGVFDQGVPLIGTEWQTDGTTPFGGIMYCIAYSPELDIYVAGGEAGLLYSSPDLVNWTARTSTFGTDYVRRAVWASYFGLFVIAGQNGKVATSPDGVTWTSRTGGIGTAHHQGLGYGHRTVVAVGTGGTVATSSDGGVTWTTRTSGTATDFKGVAYGNGIWVAVTSGVANCSSIDDGVTWTARTNLHAALHCLYAGGYHIAVGQAGYKAVTLNGGVSWTVIDDGTTFGGTYGYACASAWGAIVHFDYLIVWRTTDPAAAWSYSTTSAIGGYPAGAFTTPFDMIAVNGGFIAVGGHGSLTPTGVVTSRAAFLYADEAELLDDTLAPDPGMVGVWLNGGMFRLGATPAGLVTVDVTEGVGESDRTVAQCVARILTRRGYPLVPWDAADLAALDTAASYEVGGWWNEETTVARVLDQLFASVGAGWTLGRDGILRCAQLVAPTGTAVATFTESQVVGLERRPPRDALGIPPWRSVVRWGRYYAVQATDLAGGVSADRRGELSKEWREAAYEDTSVQLVHRLAPEIIEDSLLVTAANATTEATRRQTLRGTLRNVFEFEAALTAITRAIQLGDVVTLTHSRFGLSSGADYRVIGVSLNPITKRVTLTVWG